MLQRLPKSSFHFARVHMSEILAAFLEYPDCSSRNRSNSIKAGRRVNGSGEFLCMALVGSGSFCCLVSSSETYF